MTQVSSDVESTEALQPDPDWPARCRRRLKAGLEVLAERSEPLPIADLESLAAAREPLTAYDTSQTTTGHQRAAINFRWNINTTYQHGGLVHNGPAGYRLTSLGQSMLDQHLTAQQLYEAGVERYRAWESSREEAAQLPSLSGQPAIIHGGVAAHALRAT